MEKIDTDTIMGMIVPIGWDRQNNITDVLITTSGEREYRVKMDSVGLELLNFIRKRVKIHGIVEQKNSDEWAVKIMSYVVES